MASSIIRRGSPKQKIALALVIAMTILAIVASGLKAIDDNSYGRIHSFALVMTVAAYIFYLATLGRSQESRTVSLEPSEDGQSYIMSPSWPKQVVLITQNKTTTEKLKILRSLPRAARESVRVVVAKDTKIDLEFVHLVALFPQIVALDIQRCDVDPAVWDELIHFDHLRLILAHGTIEPKALRNLALTMPEIKICIEPSQIQTVPLSPIEEGS